MGLEVLSMVPGTTPEDGRIVDKNLCISLSTRWPGDRVSARYDIGCLSRSSSTVRVVSATGNFVRASKLHRASRYRRIEFDTSQTEDWQELCLALDAVYWLFDGQAEDDGRVEWHYSLHRDTREKAPAIRAAVKDDVVRYIDVINPGKRATYSEVSATNLVVAGLEAAVTLSNLSKLEPYRAFRLV